jgi:hypothetical protein
MDFPVDLSERKPVFVKVHIAIAAAKKAQRLVTVPRVADGRPSPASRPIRPVHRNEGVFCQLIQELREIGLQRICANRKAELKGVAILRSEGDVSVMPMEGKRPKITEDSLFRDRRGLKEVSTYFLVDTC